MASSGSGDSHDRTQTALQEHQPEYTGGAHHSYGQATLADNARAHFGDVYNTVTHFHNYPLASPLNDNGSPPNADSARSEVEQRPVARSTEIHEAHEQWTPVSRCLCRTASVQIQDGGRNGTPIEETYQTCEAKVEVMGANLVANSRRRLVIIQTEPSHRTQPIWIPATCIKVARTNSLIEIEFSNCNQMLNPTKDYINNYEAVYSPGTPNVTAQFECNDEHQASELHKSLLHLTNPSAVGESSGDFFLPFCEIRRASIPCIDGKILNHGLLVWSHITGTETQRGCNVLDLGCLSSQLDFEVEVVDNTFNLCLSSFTKIHYVPIGAGKSAYWPPPAVENNPEGAPASMELSINTKDDVMVMKVSRDRGVDLLNWTVGFKSGLRAEAWFDIDFVENPSKIGGNTEQEGQLSLWQRYGCLYGLLRNMNSAANANDEHRPPKRWRALNWSRVSRPAAKFTNDNKVMLEDLQVMAGAFLLSDSLEPQIQPDSSHSPRWEETKIRLIFRAEEDVLRLRELFRSYDVN